MNANTLIENWAATTTNFAGWCYRLSPGVMLTDRQQTEGDGTPGKVLVIKSGRAFPLGHPTTRLCLDLLTEALAARPGRSLVEIGCGSGVICLAAAALGVSLVTGLDIEKKAVKATRKNARDNGLAAAIQVVQGSSECLRERFDLVVANLPWEIQMDKAAELHRLTAPGGRLILSGFRDNQEGAVVGTLSSLGLDPEQPPGQIFPSPRTAAADQF